VNVAETVAEQLRAVEAFFARLAAQRDRLPSIEETIVHVPMHARHATASAVEALAA
jgi:hypothetical protein